MGIQKIKDDFNSKIKKVNIKFKKIKLKDKVDFSKLKCVKPIKKFVKKNIKGKYGKAFCYGSQALLIIIVISFVLGIYKIEHNNQEKKTKITDNKAEEYYYAGNYSKAVDEYIKISEKDKGNAWWTVKIAEVYSVKGDLNNSKKYIENAKKL